MSLYQLLVFSGFKLNTEFATVMMACVVNQTGNMVTRKTNTGDQNLPLGQHLIILRITIRLGMYWLTDPVQVL